MATCRQGHKLDQQTCKGNHLAGEHKHCAMCKKELLKGSIRHTCRACAYHLCQDCFERATRAKVLGGREHAPPSMHFEKGERVFVWSQSANMWFKDGMVESVAGDGTVQVRFNGGTQFKELASVHAERFLKKPDGPPRDVGAREPPSHGVPFLPLARQGTDAATKAGQKLDGVLTQMDRKEEQFKGMMAEGWKMMKGAHMEAMDIAGGGDVKRTPKAGTTPKTPRRPSTPNVCMLGGKCRDHTEEHRRQYWHPSTARVRKACKYGEKCTQHSPWHLNDFVHPGDRNYRYGLVVFPLGTAPVHETLWQLFSFYDTEESGYLSKEDFSHALRDVSEILNKGALNHETAWYDVGGEKYGNVSFSRFARWAENLGVALPVGIEGAGGRRPCRFQINDERCGCDSFQPSSDFLCRCGHKASAHRSEAAQGALCDIVVLPSRWTDREGLITVRDPELLKSLQQFITVSHKRDDNWTRDRGCTLHGVGHPHCSLACAAKNRVPVPTGYTLKGAYRNQNLPLWSKYSVTRSAIAEECSREVGGVPFKAWAGAFETDVGEPIFPGCNEWLLFHGTSFGACRSICQNNFRLSLAGTGCTWKDRDKTRGSPLYGAGAYLAEQLTKADEYSKPASKEELPPGGESTTEIYAALIVRCVGGRTHLVMTNEIDKEKLLENVLNGPYHSVYGDRVTTLKKPFREIVIYDKDQIFPEFLLLYERSYR